MRESLIETVVAVRTGTESIGAATQDCLDQGIARTSNMSNKPVRSVDRAVDIILAFIDSPVLGIGELQQRLDLPRPTLYRMVTALEQKGLVSSFGEPRRYRLGQKVLELSRAWQRSFDLVEISRPLLDRLRDACDETVMLFVPNSSKERILVHESRSSQPLHYSRPSGYVAPLTKGAAGKVILAFLSDAQLEDALASISEQERKRKLRMELERVRKERICIASGEVIQGAVSVAAPIFGHDAVVMGAVAIVGPELRMNANAREMLLPVLTDTKVSPSRRAIWAAARSRPVPFLLIVRMGVPVWFEC
ncbi:IclR family transcriptional regulator [Paraburkholderia sp. RL17-373-BIF-A]|uniref:IclR family transcriptional regulator n=1 Tax=Paraburkholderia sp. RL17-373-BIF-A TaxID=3031629 RepID=UPI0038B7D899